MSLWPRANSSHRGRLVPLEASFGGLVIQRALGSRGMTFVRMVDVYHVVEHLGKAVQHCGAKGCPEAR